MRTPAISAALLVVLAACAGGGAGGTPTSSPASMATPVASPVAEWSPPGAVPAEVAARQPLPFCGADEPGGMVPQFDVEGRTCFWTAYTSGGDAEFVGLLTTMEGDPITTIYRVASGTVEVFVDSTQDKFGSGKWSQLRCRSLVREVSPPGTPPDLVVWGYTDCETIAEFD